MRMMIILSEQEHQGFKQTAAAEIRYPRDLVRFIIRRELERLGLLQPITPQILQPAVAPESETEYEPA